MRTVSLVVHGVAIVVDEVVSVNIVDESVAIVVQSVAGDFAGIGPDVGGQIVVRVVDARVDHAHNDIAAAGRNAPGGAGVDVGVGGPAGLARVFQSP